MPISKTLVTLAALALFGCSHSANVAPTTPPPAAATAPPADDPPTITIPDDDDYIGKGIALLAELGPIFQTAGTDCNKLADGISAFADRNRPTLRAIAAYDKTHPSAKQKFEDASKPNFEAFTAIAAPAMNACGKDQMVGAAMNKLGT